MRENSLMVNSMEMASITSLTQESSMKANLSITIWKEKEQWFGLMSPGTRETSKQEKEMVRELSTLQMEITMSVNGRMIYNMDQECCIM